MASQSQSPQPRFEPCASTASLFLYAQGSVIVCLHHDTLAVERRFQHHQEDVYFIAVDNVSERGAGRLVVSYDVGQTAIVWDLFTGSEIARFASFEHLRVAAWMRNGNVVFGNGKGDVILFEPSTSEHISARTIFDPIRALAPSSDCRTYAIGYQNGSILIANLHPTFTILHTLSTSRGPSPIVSLAWHASSSKQKSDMLATQSSNGDLRVWSVAKPPGKETPRVIRVLKRSDSETSEPKWIAWSKNGRIVQYLDGETWAWDVRTKHVTYEPIPTIENVRGLANYGPTATLFTLGPQYTVQQYDLENPAMVANVQHLPLGVHAAPDDARARALQPPPEIREMNATSTPRRTPFDPNGIEEARQQRAEMTSPVSVRSHTNSVSSKASSGKYRVTPFSPPSRSAQSGTTFSLDSPAGRETPQPSGTSLAYASSISMSSMKSSRAGSRLRNEVHLSPAERTFVELFPFTRARLNDLPYRKHRPLDETCLTPDDLRRQMLSVVFGWDGDVEGLIRDELSRHPLGSPSAILLARWLGESDTDQMISMIGSGPVSVSHWMALALSQMSGQTQANKLGQAFVQKLLEDGDIHTSATVLLGLGDWNDAIEVYVSRNHFMEAILMTCLLMPSDWQRQSYLVRRWGEHVVSHSQQQLAIRCFMCTGVEPSEPWTSPTAQQVSSFTELQGRRVRSPEPSYPDPMSVIPPPQSRPSVGNRLTAKGPALKLITSFDSQPNQAFKFPGLKSDDRTPTNAPGITPIAESAVGESALSPGGLGSYRLNNIQSINQAMAGRTGTPAFTRRRLASIGETPVDVHPPSFPTSNSLSRPADTSSRTGNDDSSTTNSESQREESQGHQGGDMLTLLPSARYNPDKDTHRPSPQTAVQANSDKFAGIKGLPSPTPGLFEALKQHSRSRNGSRDRMPDGLHIHLPPSESSQSSVHGMSSPVQEQAELFSTSMSPAPTLNSLKSAKSPSISGRSIDQYISSLDEANFHVKKHRDNRPQNRERRNTDDSVSQSSRKHQPRNPSQDTRGRHGHRYIQPSKRSPSSPVPMSPEELARYNTSTDNLVDAPKTKPYSSRTRSGSKMRKGSSRTRTSSERRRQRSSSRNTSSRVREKNEPSTRGRSMDRPGSSVRSPSSPLPMSLTGQDSALQPEDMESALRLVASDRERLRSHQRSSSRRPDRGISSRRARSHSRQGREAETNTVVEPSSYSTNVLGEEMIPSGMSKEPSDEETRDIAPAPSVSLLSLAEQKRKELAAAELEARRLSLARNPSAPNIPFPGQLNLAKSPIEGPPYGNVSFGERGHVRNKISPAKTSPGYPSSSESSSSRSGAHLGLPATPKAMRHPKYSNGYEEESAPAVPDIPDNTVLLTDARYNGDAERIGRSMSVPMPESHPKFPTDIPHHPRFNPHLPRSRSTSRTRNRGHRREGSREMGSPNGLSYGSSPPVTVSIEETIEGALLKRVDNPPILPELQHLNSPPPPPPAPVSTGGISPQDSTGMIDIAIDNDNMGRSLPRAMTAAPTMTAEPRPGLERRRMSFDHRRNRSINEAFSSKIRNFTDRMRSNSRGPGLRSTESELPYESVPMIESRTISLL